MNHHKIMIDKAKCVGCGICVEDCVAHNIEVENKKARIISEDCILCGHCVAVCPREAVSITGYEESPVKMGTQTPLDPEAVLNAIRFRRSVRQFEDRKIPEKVIEQILEAGRLTHTAKNMQDLSFIVLDKEKDRLEKYGVEMFRMIKPVAGAVSPMARRNEIGDHFFFFEAPTVILIAAKSEVNATLAAQNMEFVAEANGLGVLFSGFFTVAANRCQEIKKVLDLPKGKKVAATLVLGYPKVKFFRSAPREALDVKYI